MNSPESNDPKELVLRALRGDLSEAQKREFQARLEKDKSLQELFTEEQRLENLIERLPDAPISSNFTSLVLQAARAEERKSIQAGERFTWSQFRFARVAAGLAAVVIAGFVGIKQFQQAEQKQIAQTVGAFTEVATVISTEQASPATVFQDFEAIQQLSLPAESELDLELLVALQK